VKTSTIILVSVAAAIGFLIAISLPAPAHEATPTTAKPQGWKYPFSCCGGYDCRRWTSVKELPRGYRIETTGEILAYGDKRIKDSPDEDFHWCSVAGKNDGKTICLFAPPRGM